MQRISKVSTRLMAALALATLLGLVPHPAEAAQSSFPTDPVAAMERYESDIEDWAEGPVSYLLTDAEADLWDDLESREARQAFITWFWERRDEDLRDQGNAFKGAFYERVAEANDRYPGFPRGWRSDRGRIHVVLGRPHAVRPEFGVPDDAVIWTYFTVGPRADKLPFGSAVGEFSIAFVRRAPRTGYEIYGGFGGPGIFPFYVQEALRYATEAYVVNPTLEVDLG